MCLWQMTNFGAPCPGDNQWVANFDRLVPLLLPPCPPLIVAAAHQLGTGCWECWMTLESQFVVGRQFLLGLLSVLWPRC